MTNLPAIASYYKAIKVSHSYSIHWSAGLKILVSAVRFRLRAPFTRKNPLKYANFYKRVIYSRSTLVAHFYDCIDHYRLSLTLYLSISGPVFFNTSTPTAGSSCRYEDLLAIS